jgi:endonuclease YncB( thermonuclease family)
MSLLKLIFRTTTRRKRRVSRKTSVTIVTKHRAKQSYSPKSIPHSEKVRHQNDIERIKALPLVKVGHVIDGDTVIVSTDTSQIKIRLDSIDCPEDGQEWGDIATRGLVKQIGGKTVRLESHGTDTHGRTLGTLFVYLQEKGEWQNVNERMVTLGHAWVMRLFYGHLPKSRQQKLNQLERWAKSKRVGLWKTENPIPPWKWRKQ